MSFVDVVTVLCVVMGSAVRSSTQWFILCYQENDITGPLLNDEKTLQCKTACVILNTRCFCKTPFVWASKISFNLTTKTCADFVCNDKEKVIRTDSYAISTLCPDSKKSVVFDISVWKLDEYHSNFFNFHISKLMLFREFSYDILYSESVGEPLLVDYGDGYTSNLSTPHHAHIYTSADTFDICFSSAMYGMRICNRKTVYKSVVNGIVTGCSPSPVQLDEAFFINCAGVSSSFTTSTSRWNFREGRRVYGYSGFYGWYTTLLSNEIHGPTISKCFHDCAPVESNPFAGKKFFVFYYYFQKNGFVQVVEFYARKAGTFSVEIYSYNYPRSLRSKVTLSCKKGYNYRVSPIIYKPDDMLALRMDDDLLDIVIYPGATIFLDDIQFAHYRNIGTSNSVTGYSFRMRIFGTTTSFNRVSYGPFKYTGIHDVYFTLTDNVGNKIDSIPFSLPVYSYTGSVGVKSTYETFIEKPFDVCAVVHKGGVGIIKWFSSSSSLHSVVDGSETALTKTFQSNILGVVMGSVEECALLSCRGVGTHEVVITLSVYDRIVSTATTEVTCYPQFTGLKISYKHLGDTYLNLDPVLFFGHVDPHPLSYTVTWQINDYVSQIKTHTNSSLTYKFPRPGNYNIHFNITSYVGQKSTSTVFFIKEIFTISGPSLVLVNKNVTYELITNIPTAQWMIKWHFSDGWLLNGTSKFIVRSFPNVGNFSGVCVLEYGQKTKKVKFNGTVYEIVLPVSGLQIYHSNYVEMNRNSTFISSVRNGTNVIFRWTFAYYESKKYSIYDVIQSVGKIGDNLIASSTILKSFNASGVYLITVSAINKVTTVSMNSNMTVINPIDNVTVICKSSIETNTILNISYGWNIGELVTVYAIVIKNDDAQHKEELVSCKTAPFQSAYKFQPYTAGRYRLTFLFRNIIGSEKRFNCSIVVQNAIDELSLVTIPKDILRVDETIDIQIRFYRGTEVNGLLNITSIDKEIVDLHVLNFSSCSMCDNCKCNISFPYMFSSPNIYKLTSYVYNLVSSSVQAKNVTVLGHDLKTQSIFQHQVSNVDNCINFILVFLANVTLFPHTSYQITFGDGNISTTQQLNFSEAYVGENKVIAQHMYQKLGCYQVKLEIFNKVESLVHMNEVFLYQFDHLSAEVYSAYGKRYGGNLYAVVNDILFITIHNHSGLCYSYTAEVQDTNMLQNKSIQKSIEPVFSTALSEREPGAYILYLNATIQHHSFQFLKKRFDILAQVRGLQMYHSKIVERNHNSVFVSSVRNGTNVIFRWTFVYNEPGKHSIYDVVESVGKRGDNSLVSSLILKSFDASGVYAISVSAINKVTTVSMNSNMTVINPIDNVTVICKSSIEKNTILNISFGWNIGEFVTVYALVIKNDTEEKEKLVFCKTAPFQSTYVFQPYTAGTSRLTFLFRNILGSEKRFNCSIVVQNAINGLSIATIPKDILRVDETIDIQIRFYRGTEVNGLLNITSIDKEIVDVHVLNFSSCSMCDNCKCNISFPYMFSSPNTYQLTSYVYNLVSSSVQAKNVTVLGHDLKTQSIFQHQVSNVDNSINFILVFLANVTLFPHTSYQITFGDGNVSTTQKLNFSEAYVGENKVIAQHMYQKLGCYQVELEIFNVESLVHMNEVFLYQFDHLSADVYSDHGKTYDSKLYTVVNDVLFINIHNHSGLCYNYTAEIQDINMLQKSTKQKSVQPAFYIALAEKEPGPYFLYVNATIRHRSFQFLKKRFDILAQVRGLRIHHSKIVEKSRNSVFVSSVSNGTNVVFRWIFVYKESGKDSIYDVVESTGKIGNNAVVSSVILKSFNASGVYLINVTAINKVTTVSMTTNMTVINPIENVTVVCQSSMKPNTSLNVYYGWNVGELVSVNVIVVQSDMVQKKELILHKDAPFQSSYVYTPCTTGTSRLTFLFRNIIGSEKSSNCSIIVQNAIDELSIVTIPKEILRVDETIDIHISFDCGTKVNGLLNITSIDKEIVDWHLLNFSSCSMCDNCECNISFPYMFSSPNIYKLTSYVYNLVSSSLQAKNVIVLGHDLKTQSIFQHQVSNADNSINFILMFLANVTLFPYTSYQITFGDGNISTTQKFDFSKAYVGGKKVIAQHKYQKLGCYQVKLEVSNEVESLVHMDEVFLYQFDHLSADVYSGYGKTYGGKLYAFANDILFINIHNHSGLCYNYTAEIKDAHNVLRIVTSQKSTKPMFSIALGEKQPGAYILHLNATIHRHSFQFFKQRFDIHRDVVQLTVFESTKSSLDKSKEFVIMCGSSICDIGKLFIDFGDNSVYQVFNPNFLPIQKKNLTTFLKTSSLKVFPSDSSFLVLSHTYNRTGMYVLKVYTNEEVFNSLTMYKVLVNKLRCNAPIVRISHPVNGSLVFHYTKSIVVYSSVILDCQLSKKVRYRWFIHFSNQWELKENVLSGSRNEVKPNIDMSQSVLVVPKRVLRAGIYILTLTATIENVGLTGTDRIFMVIVGDAPNAVIDGGTWRQSIWANDLHLDGSKSSTGEESEELVRYHWKSVLNVTGNISTMGYFGKKWVIKGGTLVKDAKYAFILTVFSVSTGLSSEYRQIVAVQSAKIPLLVISCLFNCGRYVNPHKRLSLSCACTNCLSSSTGQSFEWTGVFTDIRHNGNTTLDLKEQSLTGKNQNNLVVRHGALIGGRRYTLRCKVISLPFNLSSFAEYEVNTSLPPSGGYCHVSPPSGVSLHTTFTIACQHWHSAVGGINYKVFASQSLDGSNLRFIVHSFLPSMEMFLPVGTMSNGYTVGVYVHVMDMLGDWTVFPTNVRVMPPPYVSNSAIRQYVLNMTTREENRLVEYVGKKDTQGLAQLVGTIADTLTLASEGTSFEKSESEKSEFQRVRELMVGVLSETPLHTTDNVLQTAEVLNTVLSQPDEISSETQKLASGLISKMVNVLLDDNDIKSGENQDYVEKIAVNLVNGAGNLLRVTSDHADKSSPTSTRTSSRSAEEEVTSAIVQLTKNIASLLLTGKVSGEQPTRISIDNIAVQVSREATLNFPGKNISTLGAGSMKLSPLMSKLLNDTFVDIEMSTLANNPFAWHTSAYAIDAPVSSLTISSPNGTKIDISRLEEKEMIEIFIPQSGETEKLIFNSSLFNTTAQPKYRIEKTRPYMSLIFRLNLNRNISGNFTLLVNTELNKTIKTVAVIDTMSANRYIIVETDSNKTYWLQPKPTSFNTLSSAIDDIVVEYFSTGCVYWNETSEMWSGEGCSVGPRTTANQTHCLCDHMTWFGSNFFIPPNKLDVLAEISKLKDLHKYPALLATMIVIAIAYVGALVLARRKDTLTKSCEPIILLQHFQPGTLYHMAVYTGHRVGSGTSSTPSLMMYGETDSYGPMRLENHKGKELFSRGNVDTFLFSLPMNLNALECINISHDCQGPSPSWFLSRIQITKLEDRTTCVFICNRWLSEDVGNGTVQHILPIATQDELNSYENAFLFRGAYEICDNHLWMSIIMRPSRSNFTYMQRISCCLNFLLCSMLSNAMFYTVAEKSPVGNEIQLGYFTISWSEVMIGVQSCIITLPINLFLIFLFRKANPYDKNAIKQCERTRSTNASLTLTYAVNCQRELTNSTDSNLSCSDRDIDNDNPGHTVSSRSDCTIPKASSSSAHWGSWVRYVAWGLCALCSLTSAAFIILYGLSFGREKQRAWLISFAISFFTETGVCEPVKVIISTAAFSLLLRSLRDDIVEAEIAHCQSSDYHQYYHQQPQQNKAQTKNFVLPSKLYVDQLKKRRAQEVEMMGKVFEILSYLAYIIFALLIAYGHRDPDAFQATRNIENMLYTNKFQNIKSIPQFWNWSKGTFRQVLYHEGFNVRDPLHFRYLKDGVSYVLGSVRIRQTRLPDNGCMGNQNSTYCTSRYEAGYQYCEKWKSCNGNTSKQLYMWKWNTEVETGRYTTHGYADTYPGSGYIFDLPTSSAEADDLLTYLSDSLWLDDSTSAVFVSLNLYNTQSNFYTMVKLVLETLQCGGTNTFKEILTTRLDRYSTTMSIILGVCETVFVLFTFFRFIGEVKKIRVNGRDYFRKSGHSVELLTFVLIWAAIIVFILRIVIIDKVKQEYFNSRNRFVSFDSAFQIDRVYGGIFASITFLIIVKSLNILRFNKNMSRLFIVLRGAHRNLACFSLLFLVVFIAYSIAGYYLFHNRLFIYSTLINTLQSQFNLLLGKVDLIDILEVNDYLGTVFFVTFCFLMTFMMLNMFISIICDSFTECQMNMVFKTNRYDLMDFISSRLIDFLPASFVRMHQQKNKKYLDHSQRWTEKRKAIKKPHKCRRYRRQTLSLSAMELEPKVLEKTGKSFCRGLLACVDDLEIYIEHAMEVEAQEEELLKKMLQLVIGR